MVLRWVASGYEGGPGQAEQGGVLPEVPSATSSLSSSVFAPDDVTTVL